VIKAYPTLEQEMIKMKSFLTISLSLLLLTQFGCSSNQSMVNTNGIVSRSSNSLSAANKEEGQTVRWEKQGIAFTLPLDWRKDDSLSQEDEKRNDPSSVSGLVWRGPRDQRIEFNVETGEKDFPVSAQEMLEKDYENNKSSALHIEDLRYLDIGGVKGLYYRTPSTDKEQINANWLTYRHYKGKAQSVGVIVAGSRKEMELLMRILSSIKLEQD
jgi:hypothetical protein